MSVLSDWYEAKGDETLLLDYPLTEDSMVLDIGGYKGDWSAKIVEKYNPFILIFEPVKKFYEISKYRFKNNSKIHVFNFGLSDRDEKVLFRIDEDKSVPFFAGTEEAILRDVSPFIGSYSELVSINIEGGEYNLLSRLIETGKIKWCKNLQVQFHDNYPGCPKLREDIRTELSKTHEEIYNFPFVWESWRLKNA